MRKLIDPKRLIMHLNDWMFAEGCEEGWNYDKNKVVPDYERQQAIYDTIQQCIDAVFDQPVVDAEPVRHGHWELIDREEPRRYGCSQCKRMVWHEENYCPNCGAKMDGGTL